MIEITGFAKSGGTLTKVIKLTDDGAIKSNGAACVMTTGRAKRLRFASGAEFAETIAALNPTEAIALGALRSDLPDVVTIVTKDKLESLNGTAAPDLIARTAEHISYRADAPALALIDIDTKGMPPDVAQRIAEAGGFLPALQALLPDLRHVATILRSSTSAGLYRTDTGERFPGSGGFHLFVLIRRGDDTERFLRTLHDRAWLAGLGWMMLGAGGQILERSVVDRTVAAPERLVFEGPPTLIPPLAQDAEARMPVVQRGPALDTIAAVPPLTLVERSRLQELRARERQRLAPDAAKESEAFASRQARKMAERAGIPLERARGIVAKQIAGVLLPDVVLPFDDPDLDGITVANVLAEPARYAGATLADPLEGIEYGRCKAKIMRRADGAPWIHSFAHGRTIYELRYDAAAARAAINAAKPDEAADLFVRLVLLGSLAPDEVEELRDTTADRCGVGKRTLDRKLKEARREHASRQAAERRERWLAERLDRRPRLCAPAPDAERLPAMNSIDEVLRAQAVPEPPMRNAEGIPTEARSRSPNLLFELSTQDANQ